VAQSTDTFDYAISKFGAPSQGEVLPPEFFEKYTTLLPNRLINFLKSSGTGLWIEGYFQFCHPERYKPILELILAGDSDLAPNESHLIGFSAFGKMLVWNQTHKILEIDSIYHHVLCSELFKPEPDTSDDIFIRVAISGVDSESYDTPDENGKDMFQRVRKAHGPLKYGQIYAPKLHPALGGPVTVDNFRPASALEALALSAQAGPFTLRDATKFPVRDVRQIG
jgi:hypothetical protein